MAWRKNIFYECVAYVCLAFGTTFLVTAFFMALGDKCDDYIICTTNWFKQNSLDFREWLVCKDFILEDTKLLV